MYICMKCGNQHTDCEDTVPQGYPLRTSLTGNIVRVQERISAMQKFYEGLGFSDAILKIPTPHTVTDAMIVDREQRDQALFYRPATSDVSYEAFMRAVGQGDHWTVTDEGERAKIGWEPAAVGYWFWADAQGDCPRLGTTWNDLTAKLHLRFLFLEEYVIVWNAVSAETGRLLDVRTWTWLRTRFGPGALGASEYGGRVYVSRHLADDLSFPSGDVGGRALDVVV